MAASTRHRSADGSKAAKREGVPRLASSTPRASITVPVQNSRTAPFGDGPGAVAAVLSHAIWSMSHLNWTNPRARVSLHLVHTAAAASSLSDRKIIESRVGRAAAAGGAGSFAAGCSGEGWVRLRG